METLTPAATTFGRGCLGVGGGLSEIVVLKRFLDQHQIVIVQFGYLDDQVILLIVLLTFILLESLKLVAALCASRVITFGEVSLSALVTVVARWNVVLPLNVGELFFLNFDDSGGSRPLRRYLFILILLLIHDGILMMNGVLIIPVLLL
jgi:hypothetical protein